MEWICGNRKTYQTHSEAIVIKSYRTHHVHNATVVLVQLYSGVVFGMSHRLLLWLGPFPACMLPVVCVGWLLGSACVLWSVWVAGVC